MGKKMEFKNGKPVDREEDDSESENFLARFLRKCKQLKEES